LDINPCERKSYLAHRLAWLYVYGEWPGKNIDHENTIRTHNGVANLREATGTQNNVNIRLPIHNTSGFKGVSWANKYQKWRAAIQIKGKSIFIGHFDSPAVAHTAYLNRARELFGEFARAA